MSSQPYRYHISDLKQLSACKSNNSRELHLSTSMFVNDDRLSGMRIQVIHDTFGVLFACTISARGTMITPYPARDEFTVYDIIQELKKYGFLIDYDPVNKLPQKQIEFLETVNKLGFDKIRVLTIFKDSSKTGESKSNVTLFNVAQNPKWIQNVYCATQDEYNKALNEGSAFNVSSLPQARKFDWTWLDFVADIDDIIKDNMNDLWRDRD